MTQKQKHKIYGQEISSHYKYYYYYLYPYPDSTIQYKIYRLKNK